MKPRHPHPLLLLMLATSVGGCAHWQEKISSAPSKPSSQPADAKMRDIYARDGKLQASLDLAASAYREGRIDESAMAYHEALAIDPINQRALSGLKRIEADRRHAEWLDKARNKLERKDEMGAEKLLRQILVEDSDHVEARALLAPLIAKVDEKRSNTPVLKSSSRKPVTMEFRDGEVKAVFEALSKATGFNFILDKDIRPDQKISVFLKNAVMEDAIDGLLAANQLQKKVLNETTMVVYPNLPHKAKEYQDLVVRSYYIANGDVTKVQALLKAMLQLKDMYVDEKLGLIVLKDTPEVLKLADNLIQLQDRPDPEVVLDVEVIEVNRNLLTEIGIVYPNQLSVVATASSSSSGATTGAALTLNALRHLNDGKIGVSPSPLINFSKSEGDVNLLANPSIRVKNREKARVHIGDRVPIITSNVASTGTIAETVQYVDVGLKLEVEPTVNVEDEVAIRINLDVGSLGTPITTKNGSTVYQIGTRNASTMLRLKDGETQVLAGLVNDEDRNSASKVPGLGDIPLIGRLFSNNKTDRKKTDIILSITPHVIRNVAPLTADVGQFWLGPESAIGKPGTNVSIPGFLQPMIRPTAPAAAPAAAPAPGTPASPPTLSQPVQGLPGGLILTPNGLQQSR